MKAQFCAHKLSHFISNKNELFMLAFIPFFQAKEESARLFI